MKKKKREIREPESLPSALKYFKEIENQISDDEVIFFLDFDGTLAPIVSHPEDAAMDDEMKDLLQQLSEKYETAIISGRSLEDVMEKAGLQNIFYAGSHGLEISGLNNFQENEQAQTIIAVLKNVESILEDPLKNFHGIRFERKKFSLAIHYRQVSPEQQSVVMEIIQNAVREHPQLKINEGKKVNEIMPNVNWNKGKAVQLLKRVMKTNKNKFSIYLGDDLTDENVFETLTDGAGILVGDHGKATFADYHLNDIEDVKIFFKRFLKIEK